MSAPPEIPATGFDVLPPEMKDALIAKAHQSNAEHRRKLQQLIDNNRKLLESNSVYLGGGPAEFAVFFIFGTLSFNILFVGNPSGTLSFSGQSGIFGLGAWEGLGAAVFSLPPNQISPNGTVIVTTAALAGGSFLLQVFDNNNVLYGTITGPTGGVGVGVGSVGGSYTWSG